MYQGWYQSRMLLAGPDIVEAGADSISLGWRTQFPAFPLAVAGLVQI